MKTIHLNDIEIKYNYKNIFQIKKLLKYLKNNPDTIKELLPSKITTIKDDNQYTYIENLEEYLIDKIKETYNYESPIPLDKIYFVLISKKCKNKGFISIKTNTSTDCFYSYVARHYYHTEEEYVNYILNNDESEKEKMYKYLEDKYQLKVYNMLLNMLKDYIKKLDENYLETIDYYQNSLENLYNKLSYLQKIFKKANTKITKLSFEEVDSIFRDYLLEKDETGLWLTYYLEGIKNKEIEFIEANECEESYAGKNKMQIVLEHNLSDLTVLAHEFAHYVSLKVDYPDIINTEISSIYYEQDILNYLQQKGYNKEEIYNIKYLRNSYFLYLLSIMLPINIDLLTNEINSTTNEINNSINLIVSDGLDIIAINSYLIGKVLLSNIKENQDITKEMFYITNNLAILDIQDIEKIIRSKTINHQKML